MKEEEREEAMIMVSTRYCLLLSIEVKEELEELEDSSSEAEQQESLSPLKEGKVASGGTVGWAIQ